MKLSPERQQKVDTLLKELNTLNTRYEQKGFKFEAFQPYDFDELIQVVIENDKYQLKSNIRANMRLLTEETKKLMDCFFDLPLKLYTFNQFIISFQHEGFEPCYIPGRGMCMKIKVLHEMHVSPESFNL